MPFSSVYILESQVSTHIITYLHISTPFTVPMQHLTLGETCETQVASARFLVSKFLITGVTKPCAGTVCPPVFSRQGPVRIASFDLQNLSLVGGFNPSEKY